jgi:conjugative transfer signal peptidase TraF
VTNRRLGLALWYLGLCLGSTVTCADYAGIRINTTPSVPVGLWKLSPASTSLSRGEYVELCPPDTWDFQLARLRGYLQAGSCPNGYEPLFKPVSAVPGDVVTVSSSAIAVNGRNLPNSHALQTDRHGLPLRAWPTGQSLVPPDQVWVVSSHTPDSFDSRYFGPVAIDTIRGRIIPLWVWGGRHDRP